MAMTQSQRNAAYERIRRDLGVDRIGTGRNAPPLPPRASAAKKPGAALDIEAEIYGAQMYEFGEVWGRPGLDLRTRSFITVAALTGMRAGDPLYRHINCALNLGITPEEIHEVLLHCSSYGGSVAWENGVSVANEVFVARGILPAGSGVTVVPKPPMTYEERRAARERVVTALGVGRVGLGPDAPFLSALPGGPVLTQQSQALENDIAYINADFGYGELWGRPGLPLRIRSFVTMSVLQVMVESHQLHIHVANALNIGITRDEINEALCQTGVYHGSSGWHYAVTAARHVFEQHPAAGGTPRSK
jgi:4-carboxymuconolactone decarboxylase